MTMAEGRGAFGDARSARMNVASPHREGTRAWASKEVRASRSGDGISPRSDREIDPLNVECIVGHASA